VILIIEDDVPVIFETGNRSSVYRKGHPLTLSEDGRDGTHFQKTDDAMSVILTLPYDEGRRMTGYGLPEKSRETIVAILARNGADRIAVFGSYARGEAGATSDVDILVRFARPKSLFQLVRIEDELKRALGRDVDLVTENAVSPYLADAIYSDAVVIYDARGSRVSPPHP